MSLNTHEKTEDQKKKTSESIFNSEITDKNSPVNAIRRVVTKKKKKIPRPPGISGVIEEDVEGEDEEDEEEEVVEQEQAAVYDNERVHAEMSSDDDAKAKKVELVQKDSKEGKDGKDSKKDKKEKEKKDKKDSKKEKENNGYKPEDIEKGKKLMANTSFKSNLDRLRQKFKDAGKSGIDESPENMNKKKPEEVQKERVPEVKNVKSSIMVEEVDPYGKQSEVILGQKDSGASDLRTSAYGTNTRGMKDMTKSKPITPEVKFGQPPKLVKEPVSQPKEVTTSEIFEKKKVTISEAPSKAYPEKTVTYTDTTKPEDSSSIKSSTKAGSSLSKDDQKYAEDWSLQNGDAAKPKTKLSVPTLNQKNGLATTQPPSLLKKKKKSEADDSDNSWDADKNPFE